MKDRSPEQTPPPTPATTARDDSAVRNARVGIGRVRRNYFVYWWLPVAIWGTAIIIGTSIPGANLPRLPFSHSDLLLHATLYGGLGLLIYRALCGGTALGCGGWTWLAAFLIGQAYGLFDELHQIPIPGRYFAWTDLLADGMGAALGGLVGVIIYSSLARRRRRAQRSKNPAADSK